MQLCFKNLQQQYTTLNVLSLQHIHPWYGLLALGKVTLVPCVVICVAFTNQNMQNRGKANKILVHGLRKITNYSNGNN